MTQDEFRAFVTAMRPRLLKKVESYSTGKLGFDEADEIVQQTIRYWSLHLDKLDATNPVMIERKFLTSLKRDVMDYFRVKSRNPEEPLDTGRIPDMTYNPFKILEAAASDVERDRLIRSLYSAVENLPERQRQVIRGVYFDGLSQTELASRLGVSLQAVNQAVFRALARLRRVLNSEMRPPISPFSSEQDNGSNAPQT